MDSPQTLETCVEHKLPVADKNKERLNRVQRGQWLRAAILGANDGLISTTSLMLGVGAAKEDQRSMILSGLAGALAGACSMAVGEFVSVATQRDIEKATVLDHNCNSKTESCGQDGGGDHVKLHITETTLAMSPALTPSRRMAGELAPGRKLPLVFSPARSPMLRVIAEDAKTSRVQKEVEALPNPYKASAASALAFVCGSLVPLLSAMFVGGSVSRIVVIVVVSSLALALFGGLGAHLGGSPVRTSAVRVLLGGWLSMAVTYGLLKPLDRDDKGHEHHTD